MTREQEVEALQAQARALGEQLRAIQARIDQLARGAPRGVARAVVDASLCVGCGACEEVCPAGAIAVNEVAVVDPARCTGCGRCVAECAHEAVSLREAAG